MVFAARVAIGLENTKSLMWFANGLLLTYLLLAPRWRWPRYLASGFLALLAGSMMTHSESWITGFLLSLLNMVEIIVAAVLLRRRSAELPRFTEGRYLFRFTMLAVLAAPALAGFLFAAIYSRWTHFWSWRAFFGWFTCDALGIAVVTPAVVGLIQSGLRTPMGGWRTHWFCPVALVTVTYFSFCQERIPIIFLIYPMMALVLFRFGLGWATLSTLMIATIGGWFTVNGSGPFAKFAGITALEPATLLQLYIASCTVIMFTASSVMDTLKRTERRLREIAYLHQLVTDNSRDVIILTDFDGQRSYVSASASALTGWGRDELLGQTRLDLVHPDDLPRAAEMLRTLRMGGEGDLLECRLRHKRGNYIWVEANMRPVRDPGSGMAIGILNIVRDISERKQAENDLRDANAALEALAVSDPLTGIANRRRFDQHLTAEWRRGLREHQPLSLLMLDADWFKSYNDRYGHTRGDSCLKEISEAALEVVNRPGDLVARVGGEEFAVILPNTTAAGAVDLANQIREAIRRRCLPHTTNPTGWVTVSIGCASMIPALGRDACTLIELADHALYAAKGAGRNRVCTAAENLSEKALEAS